MGRVGEDLGREGDGDAWKISGLSLKNSHLNIQVDSDGRVERNQPLDQIIDPDMELSFTDHLAFGVSPWGFHRCTFVLIEAGT